MDPMIAWADSLGRRMAQGDSVLLEKQAAYAATGALLAHRRQQELEKEAFFGAGVQAVRTGLTAGREAAKTAPKAFSWATRLRGLKNIAQQAGSGAKSGWTANRQAVAANKAIQNAARAEQEIAKRTAPAAAPTQAAAAPKPAGSWTSGSGKVVTKEELGRTAARPPKGRWVSDAEVAARPPRTAPTTPAPAAGGGGQRAAFQWNKPLFQGGVGPTGHQALGGAILGAGALGGGYYGYQRLRGYQ